MAIDLEAKYNAKSSADDKKFLSVKIERDELERNLGGGLPLNSFILFEGKDGAGKSVISQRLAYSFLKNNATVSYISTELNTPSFIEQMHSMDYDIKYDMLAENLLFMPMFPLFGKSKPSSNYMKRIFSTKKIFDKDVIIFDTLSFLLIEDNISQEKSFEILSTFKKIASMDKIIIVSVDPEHINNKFLTLMRSMCDIYINIDIRQFAGNTVRTLSISRFKRPKGEYISPIPFKVQPGKGLTIEIASFT